MIHPVLPRRHDSEPVPDVLPLPVDPDKGPTPDLLPDDPGKDGVTQPVGSFTLIT
jgi:hypothetical protein